MTNQTSPHAIMPIANPFVFSTDEIRTATDELGSSWFCAKDVCDSLGITWNGSTLKNMPKEWTCMLKVSMQSGSKETTFISEPALYRLVFRSNKAKAIEFANWVCEEVLPSIRKHGSFGKTSPSQRLQFSQHRVKLAQQIAETKNESVLAILQQELRDISNLVGHTVPAAVLEAE